MRRERLQPLRLEGGEDATQDATELRYRRELLTLRLCADLRERFLLYCRGVRVRGGIRLSLVGLLAESTFNLGQTLLTKVFDLADERFGFLGDDADYFV